MSKIEYENTPKSVEATEKRPEVKFQIERKELKKEEVKILGDGYIDNDGKIAHFEVYGSDYIPTDQCAQYLDASGKVPGKLVTELTTEGPHQYLDGMIFSDVLAGKEYGKDESKRYLWNRADTVDEIKEWDEIPDEIKQITKERFGSDDNLYSNKALVYALDYEYEEDWDGNLTIRTDNVFGTKVYLIERDATVKSQEITDSDFVYAELGNVFDYLTVLTKRYPQFFTINDPDLIHKIRDQVYHAMQKIDEDQAKAGRNVIIGKIQEGKDAEEKKDVKSIIQQKLSEAEKNFQEAENEEKRKQFEDQYKRLASLEMYRAALATGAGQSAIDVILSARNEGGFTDEEKELFDMIIGEYSPQK